MLQATTVPRDSSDRQRAAVLAIFRIVRASLALSPADHVDVGAKRLIATLADSGGPVRPSDLAVAANLDLSTVSRHLASLETQELVRRTRDASDGRACVVELTTSGRDLLEQMIDHRVATIAPVIEDWDASDRRQLFDLLLRLADAMERARAETGQAGGRP